MSSQNTTTNAPSNAASTAPAQQRQYPGNHPLEEDDLSLYLRSDILQQVRRHRTAFPDSDNLDDLEEVLVEQLKSVTQGQYRRFELYREKLGIQSEVERMKLLKEEWEEIAEVLRAEQQDVIEGVGGWTDIVKEDMKAPRRGLL